MHQFPGHRFLRCPEIKSLLENGIQCVVEWLCANKLTLNVIKIEFMIVSLRRKLATHVNTFKFSDKSNSPDGTGKYRKEITNLHIMKKAKP